MVYLRMKEPPLTVLAALTAGEVLPAVVRGFTAPFREALAQRHNALLLAVVIVVSRCLQ